MIFMTSRYMLSTVVVDGVTADPETLYTDILSLATSLTVPDNTMSYAQELGKLGGVLVVPPVVFMMANVCVDVKQKRVASIL